MAITFTNNRTFATPASSFWVGQSAASLSCFIRFESRDSTLNVSGLIKRSLSSAFTVSTAVTSSNPNGISLYVTIFNDAGSQVKIVNDLSLGVTYHLAVTHVSGQQILWINGYPKQFGSLTGSTRIVVNDGVSIGSVANTPFVWTLDDLAAWSGYALTQDDVAALRDKELLPPAIGASATKRFRWTLAGPVGTNAAQGQPGLSEAFGDGTQNFGAPSGSGTAIYSPDLEVLSTVGLSDLYVATSGKTIGFRFKSKIDGSFTMPISPIYTPTLSKNGASLGKLVKPYVTGVHENILYCLPDGMKIEPGDTVKLTAPNGWFLTQAGVSEALHDVPVDNRVGRSAVGSDPDQLERTLRFGWNLTHIGTVNWTTWLCFANRAKIMSQFGNVTGTDATGKPTALSSTVSQGNVILPAQSNNIDSTGTPFQQGYYALGWDDPQETLDFTLISNSSQILCTEVTSLANPGVGGIGKVRVYNIRYANISSTTDYGAPIAIKMTCPSKAPRFDNLVVYSPGDFSYQENTPTVLDRTDPWRLNSVLKDRLANGCGSLRWVDTTIGYGGMSSLCEPEQEKTLDDFAWGNGFPKLTGGVKFVQARPWNDSVTPYVYSDLFGTPFPATLAHPIDDTTTTLIISDAATAPVLVGLKLRVGNEEMRVLDVNGITVTVKRAANFTTATPHAAGPIQVLNRQQINWGLMQPAWQVLELVSQDPHKIRSLQGRVFSSGWPLFTFADNSTIRINNYSRTAFVTGANTFIIIFTGGGSTGATNLSTTYALDPTIQTMDLTWPVNDGFPFAATAIATARFPNCDLHVNIPAAASDALVDSIARQIRDHFPTGRTIWLEYGNELWNWGFSTTYTQLFTSKLILPNASTDKAWAVARLGQTYNRFVRVFNENGRNRGGEIKTLYNSQQGATGVINGVFNYARTNSIPIHAMAIAPYIQVDRSVDENLRQYWRIDDDQVVDHFIHDVYYNTKSNSYIKMTNSVKALIDSYNAATNMNCVLYGYEGGSDAALPIYRTSLTAAITDSQTTLPVSETTGFIAGMWLRIDARTASSEWITVDAVLSSTSIRVFRGQGGTAAVAHAANADVRTAVVERNRDIQYNPNYYVAEQDIYALFQKLGFYRFNTYGLCMTSSEISLWGAYRWQGQTHGRGNSSAQSGGTNNLFVATPGMPNTKSPTWNQDFNSTSVRGQLFLDWMSAFPGGAPIDSPDPSNPPVTPPSRSSPARKFPGPSRRRPRR